MNQIPMSIGLLFAATTLITVGFFYKASHYSKTTLFIVLAWLAIQALVGLSGFYTVTNALPPRIVFAVAPPFILIVFLMLSTKGKNYLDQLNTSDLTMLHIVRVPVEIVLFFLFLHKQIPELMTFEGRNFDILSGLTAPIVYYFAHVKKQIGKRALLAWNIACLALLANIVVNAILSTPSPFQQFAFEQPNLAVLYFPFLWLPCCVVPIVLVSHLASIRQLLK